MTSSKKTLGLILITTLLLSMSIPMIYAPSRLGDPFGEPVGWRPIGPDRDYSGGDINPEKSLTPEEKSPSLGSIIWYYIQMIIEIIKSYC